MKNYFLSLFFVLLTVLSLGQAQKGKSFYLINLDEKSLNTYDKHLLDSLLPVYHTTKNDTNKLKVLKYFASALSDEKIWVPYNNLLYTITFGKTDTMSRTYNADALNNKGYEYQYLRNEVDSAIGFYNKALELNTSAGYAPGMGIVLNNLAYIYQQQGNLEKCIDLYNQADMLFTKSNYSEGLISININLGDIYFKNEDYTKAEESFKKALAFSNKTKSNFLLGNVYSQLGAIYRHKKKHSQSFQYYLQSGG